MNAAILSIGDELVSGVSVDTNSAWLAGELAAIGIETVLHLTVGDHLAHIVQAIRHAATHAAQGVVLITGGLGPTEDDLTRQALADAMNEKLIEDPAALAQVERFFKQVNRPMAPSNRLQALRPESAGILENTNGTAPGLHARLEQADIFVMPGVPREMKQMFTRSILPTVQQMAASRGQGTAAVRRAVKINTFGTGESTVGEKIKDLMVRGGFQRAGAHVSVGTTAADGIVSVRIYAAGTPDQTTTAIEQLRQEIQQRLGPIIYGENDDSLEGAVATLLKERHASIATAESCTGGLMATLLTNIAGSSDYFIRGWITYANEAKADELGVPAPLIAAHGAVSEEVARAMAEGARRAAGTQWAISTTGVAGPGGGSPEKPVGTVWIAHAGPQGTTARRFIFPGNRSQIRLRAAQMALAHLRWQLMGVESPA